MNKKPLDTLVSQQNYNDTLFKQSIALVQSTKNITPISKIPLQLIGPKASSQLKKKQQTLQTHLSKTIKLFGQVLGVSKNSFGTMTDFATEVFDQLTDLIETSCQGYVERKKMGLKASEKEKEKEKEGLLESATSKNGPTRPQDRYPSIKPAHFDRHSHCLPPTSKIITHCPHPHPSQPLSDPFIYINTLQSLQKMITQLQHCRQIAVDVQHSMKSYQGLTCLIQISSRSKDYILDVFPLWQHIPLLKQLIENENIVKVMHGAEMDTKWLQRDFNVHIVNLFDTYKASRVLGYPKFSYAYLLHHYCDTVIDKRYQLADWRERPLSGEMLNYARMDTHYLLQIWDKLIIDLTKQSTSMNLDPLLTITEIYRSSHEVTLSQVQLFTYRKKELYQNLKNDTKAEDFEIIEAVFWVIDKVAKEEDENFDDLINRRTLTDVVGRVKDLLQNRRATVDMLRVKIDRLVGVVRAHKHEKVGLLLVPLKRELDRYFVESKKEGESSGTGKNRKVNGGSDVNEAPLIELLDQSGSKQQGGSKAPQQLPSSHPAVVSQEKFSFFKPSSTIEQLQYPLKTYQNFSLQQRLNNKKSAFSLIEFQPIMSFLSTRYSIQEKTPAIEQESDNLNDSLQSEQMELEGQPEHDNNNEANDQQQNEGFLQFKRIKPNVIYTLEEEQEEQAQDEKNRVEQKPRKKRKQQEYQKKLRNKDGNIYDLLEDV